MWSLGSIAKSCPTHHEAPGSIAGSSVRISVVVRNGCFYVTVSFVRVFSCGMFFLRSRPQFYSQEWNNLWIIRDKLINILKGNVTSLSVIDQSLNRWNCKLRCTFINRYIEILVNMTKCINFSYLFSLLYSQENLLQIVITLTLNKQTLNFNRYQH